MNLLGLGLRSGINYGLYLMRPKRVDSISSEMGGRVIVELRYRIFRGAAQETVEGRIDDIRDRKLKEGAELFRQGK